MRKRNVALVAAYKTIEEGFSKYRKRVVDEFGEEKDMELFRGYKFEEVIDEEMEEGATVKVITHVDPNGLSPYAKFFDETNVNWRKTPSYNMVFLRSQQQYANDMLHTRGHVLLNDVYDSIGIPRTTEGAVVGWILSKEGDNFIDFGIYKFESEAARRFVNGEEDSILLDFNVDGVIYDKI
jgi:hypothetical protein